MQVNSKKGCVNYLFKQFSSHYMHLTLFSSLKSVNTLPVLGAVVAPNTPAYSRIVHHFGSEILLENGEIDRQKLGQIIFASAEKRKLLNSITHPEIHRAMLKEVLFHFLKGAVIKAGSMFTFLD